MVLQGLREPWRAMWFHLADPWPAQAPVLWTPSTGHVTRLRADLERLPLDDLGTLAVTTDPALHEQGFYQYVWLAYLLPEHDLIWTPNDEVPPDAGSSIADARLVFRDATLRLVPLSP